MGRRLVSIGEWKPRRLQRDPLEDAYFEEAPFREEGTMRTIYEEKEDYEEEEEKEMGMMKPAGRSLTFSSRDSHWLAALCMVSVGLLVPVLPVLPVLLLILTT